MKRLGLFILCLTIAICLIPHDSAMAEEVSVPEETIVMEVEAQDASDVLAEELPDGQIDDNEKIEDGTEDELTLSEEILLEDINPGTDNQEIEEEVSLEEATDESVAKAAEAYFNYLEERKSIIACDDLSHSGNGIGCIAFADVTGDSIEEMFYVYEDEEFSAYNHFAKCVTYNDGKVVEIKHGDRSDFGFIGLQGLFLTDNSNHLFCVSQNFSGVHWSLSEYRYENGEFISENSVYIEGWEEPYRYGSYDESGHLTDSDRNKVKQYLDRIIPNISNYLMGYTTFYKYNNAFGTNIDCMKYKTSLSYYDAVEYLSKLSGKKLISKPIKVTELTLDKTNETLKTKQTLQLTATLKPNNAEDKSVTWKSSNPAVASVDKNGKVTAKTYGKASITATSNSDSSKKASCEIQTQYYDVTDMYKYWYTPVYWAADKGITRGYGNVYFGPERNCKREEMITFLWRKAGSPAPRINYSPFSDVKDPGNYYYKAVLWAYENAITKGYSSGKYKGKFGVGLNISREDTVTFIYRMAGQPKVSNSDLNKYTFKDIKKNAYYQKAVAWAAKKGITKGYSSGQHKGKFGVGLNVLRKDIVTFLHRYATKAVTGNIVDDLAYDETLGSLLAKIRMEYNYLDTYKGNYNIFKSIFSVNPGYSIADWRNYPLPYPQDFWETKGAKKDPLGRFTNYYKTDAKALQWIAYNIFNVSKTAYSDFMKKGFSDWWISPYYYKGFFYSGTGGVGGFIPHRIYVHSATYKNGYYYVEYAAENEIQKDSGDIYYAVLKHKEIDGNLYWSLYTHSKKGFIEVK